MLRYPPSLQKTQLGKLYASSNVRDLPVQRLRVAGDNSSVPVKDDVLGPLLLRLDRFLQTRERHGRIRCSTGTSRRVICGQHVAAAVGALERLRASARGGGAPKLLLAAFSVFP